jgi:hypothetical protein
VNGRVRVAQFVALLSDIASSFVRKAS